MIFVNYYIIIFSIKQEGDYHEVSSVPPAFSNEEIDFSLGLPALTLLVVGVPTMLFSHSLLKKGSKKKVLYCATLEITFGIFLILIGGILGLTILGTKDCDAGVACCSYGGYINESMPTTELNDRYYSFNVYDNVPIVSESSWPIPGY
eukprot:gb/GECH01010476.1/.p1 GENE.gb/GECH01010476.1/~~gb/GECH01010476.1/.p1  ORF type:complete len:148 (+),score=26.49 gb/GECH01010476.1/:1-444(+)